MIYEERKAIFVHITKTGGMTITSLLGPGDGKHRHRTLAQYAKAVCVDDYFTFAFVRNPWDRMVSEYSFQTQRAPDRRTDLSFREYLLSDRPKQVCNQVDWIQKSPAENSSCVPEVDFIGRYERFQEDLMVLLEILDIPRDNDIPRENASTHGHYLRYYDEDLRNIVAKNHHKDIEFFGYEF
jgi:hypothetical protein